MASEPLHLLSLCSAVVSAAYLIFGGFILHSNPRERMNQIFALICLVFFCWSFAYAFLPGAASKQQAWLWFRLSAPGWTLSPSLLLHFLILLSGRRQWLRRRSSYVLIYLPGVYYLLQAQFGSMGVVDFVWTPYGWSDVYEPLTVSYAGYLVYFSVYILVGLGLVAAWGRGSDLIAEKQQARLIVYTGLPVLAGVSLSGIFLPWMEIRTPPEVAHLIAPIWVLAICYAVSAYRLMVMTPAAVAHDILETMADSVLLVGRDQRILAANQSAEGLLAFPEHELLGKRLQDLLELDNDTERLAVERVLAGARRHSVELRYRRADGEPTPVRLSASPVRDRHGQIAGGVLVIRDLTEQKQVEADLEHLATHDPLTGLPNRTILHDRLERALRRAAREKKPFALLMFDLNDFNRINDTYGQMVGDLVLQSTARRLQQCVRGLDTVCRLGGDEFLLVVEDLLESGDCDIVARRILAAFEDPVEAGERPISVTASIGISTYPFDGLDPETLIKKADLALNSVKQSDKSGFQFYAPRMDAINRERTTIEQGLRLALARDELYLVYQPLVEFKSGRVAGYEALLRWRSADIGLIGPAKFIPVAERSNLILPIGRWVLETACKTSREWQEIGLPAVPMSVNISPKQLQQEDFVAMVEEVLRDSGLSPNLLELELTETAAMKDMRWSQEIFGHLHALGVRIAIDDFGTGYSSLMRLKVLPMRAIKVDRSFIKHIAEDPRDRAFVMAILALARNLGVEVIAEGVETREQLEVLRSFEAQPLAMFRCDKLQGNLFSGPIAKDEIPELLARLGESSPGAPGFKSVLDAWDPESGSAAGSERS